LHYSKLAACAAVASNMDETEHRLQVLLQQDQSQIDLDAYTVAYQKFKLLTNFLDLTTLPIGIKEAIESKRKTRIFKC
jgi:hypothetical protein